MSTRRLLNENITNLLLDDNGDYSIDEIEDDDYIPSDDDREIDDQITDFVFFDEEDNSFQNTTEYNSVMSKSVPTNFTSRNKPETVPEMASAG